MAQENKFEIITSINKVRSKYILSQIFDNVRLIKKLEIARYNKNIKKKLKIKINDFKKEYSIIEIEIIPKENEYGKFIDLPKEKGESNYHIYFNDDKEEIKRKYYEKNDKVKKIKIRIDYQIKSFEKLFYNCQCISSINFKKFERTNITNMSYMFSGCLSLKKLNLSSFDTSKVIVMNLMFAGYTSLEELNLSNFNTNNLIYMYYMFKNCSS